jgi:hypothetical protein
MQLNKKLKKKTLKGKQSFIELKIKTNKATIPSYFATR